MNEAMLNPDEIAKEKAVEDALLACHAKGTLSTHAFLKGCVEFADRAVRRRDLLRKLLEVRGRVPVGMCLKDYIEDLSDAANVPLAKVFFALGLQEGFESLAHAEKANDVKSLLQMDDDAGVKVQSQEDNPVVSLRQLVTPDPTQVTVSACPIGTSGGGRSRWKTDRVRSTIARMSDQDFGYFDDFPYGFLNRRS